MNVEHFTQVLNRPKPTETATVDENFGDQLDIELEPPTKRLRKPLTNIKTTTKLLA